MSFGQNPNYYNGGPPPQHNYGPPQGPPSGQYAHQQQHQGFPGGGQPYPMQEGYPPGPPHNQFPLPNQGYPPQYQNFPSTQGNPPYQGRVPPPGGFGGQPQGQFDQQGFNAPPILPSPGYDPRAVALGDASHDVQVLRQAIAGPVTDGATLIRILSKPDPLQMALLRNTYHQQTHRNLDEDIRSQTSSHFKEGLLALVRGPLMQDVHNVKKAIKGLGTREIALNDVLCGRSNADMNAIKIAYEDKYGTSMTKDVEDDLSRKTARLFGMIMSANRAEESSPVIPQELEKDVTDLYQATDGRPGTDQMTVCSIIAFRSDGQLRAIAQRYRQKYQVDLSKTIKKEFSGHMEDALLLMLGRATDRAMTDAVQLEDSMKGAGTREDLLINRIVRCHWDRAHVDQVKRAYRHRYTKDLVERVRGEIRGDFERLMIACLTE